MLHVSFYHLKMEIYSASIFSIQWAESQDAMQKNRQRLSDALMNPMQRLTRYSLLLRAVYKPSVDDTERDKLSVSSISVVTLIVTFFFLFRFDIFFLNNFSVN